ncbi:hypothetical protein Tco_0366490 [Tanacetum coccineum]
METIHVKFDELTSMASECNNLEPEFSRFIRIFTNSSSKIDLDNLFGPLYEEYYAMSPLEVLDNSATNTLDNENTSSSSSIVVEEDEASQIVSSSTEQVSSEPNTLVLSENANEFIQEYDPSNMHEFHQTHRSTNKWTKNHPIEQVIGDPSKPVMTRRQLHTDVEVFFHMAQQIIPTAHLVPKFQIPCSPKCKIVGKILLDHPLSYALTAIGDLDSQEIVSTVDMFRDTLNLLVETPEKPFVTPVNIEIIESFMNKVGYQGVVDKEICATDDFKEYETVFMNVAVLMNQPQPVVSTQGTHRSTPRAHRTPTLTSTSPQGKKRK